MERKIQNHYEYGASTAINLDIYPKVITNIHRRAYNALDCLNKVGLERGGGFYEFYKVN